MKGRQKLVEAVFLLLFIIVLSGCSGCGPEVSLPMEESQEETAGKRAKEETNAEEETSYWTVFVNDYEVSLRDMVPGRSLKLVLKQNESEVIADIFQKNVDYEEAAEITAAPFENLLGYNGFYIHMYYGHMDWVFYNIIEEGKIVCLVYSWGTEYRPSENYMVDIDGDGELELICNVTYGGDGAERTYIYHYSDGQIWEGDGIMLLDKAYDDWGVNSRSTEYLSDEDVIRIWFWSDEQGDYESQDYKIDLDQLEMHPYEAEQMFQ